jgi:hypothetical protein
MFLRLSSFLLGRRNGAKFRTFAGNDWVLHEQGSLSTKSTGITPVSAMTIFFHKRKQNESKQGSTQPPKVMVSVFLEEGWLGDDVLESYARPVAPDSLDLRSSSVRSRVSNPLIGSQSRRSHPTGRYVIFVVSEICRRFRTSTL